MGARVVLSGEALVLSCEVARRLIAAKIPGRMVNTSSVGVFNYAGGGATLYSITKSGIVLMTGVLAVDDGQAPG